MEGGEVETTHNELVGGLAKVVMGAMAKGANSMASWDIHLSKQ
jgi:hypothetical protein